MGLLDEVKEARQAKKDLKRKHILASTVYTIKQGTYKFNYGYNSDEDLQEIKEVVAELNEELKEDKFVLKLVPTNCRQTFYGYEIYVASSSIGKFHYYIEVLVDAL